MSTQNSDARPRDEAFDNQPYRVVKSGRVLTLKEEREMRFKSADIASIANQGLVYYQVISNQGACEKCEEHNGAIYPVAEAKERENLPPFHPNCKCTVQGFNGKNPNHDPWLAETLFWLDIMYGDGTMEQKAKKLLDFYHWTEYSVEFIASILSAIDNIKHIGKRMEELFRLLDMEKSEQSVSPNGDNTFQLPGVHFKGKPYPLAPLEVTLPSEWVNYAYALAGMLNIDYYLVLAFILHESGEDPEAHNTDIFDDPMQQASGLMQIIPYWHSAYQEGGQYYSNYTDVIAFAEQNGADINNLFDPLGNITIGIMMLNEQRKLCNDPTDMRELVGRYGEDDSPSTIEILYYRDLLAMQAGVEPWYSDEYYSSQMKK